MAVTTERLLHSCRKDAGLSLDRILEEVASADESFLRAYLLGAMGDGTWRRTTVRISQSDPGWCVVLRSIFREAGYPAWAYREGRRRMWVVEGPRRSVDPPFEAISPVAYLRGLFDAEGGFPRFMGARFYIQLAQQDRANITLARKALHDLGVRCGRVHIPSARVDPKLRRFYVLSDSWATFAQEVSSWHPRKRDILIERAFLKQPGL